MKKELLLGLFLSLFAIGAKAQTADTLSEQDDVEELITCVEVTPEFPGGFQALEEFITTNLNYPQEAKEAGIEGRVFVSFIVEKEANPFVCDFSSPLFSNWKTKTSISFAKMSVFAVAHILT